MSDASSGNMNWGTELWDQYDNLAAHTQKGIDFLDKYGSFVRERCAIEMEYAAKLRRLVKNYQPKRKEEEEYQYSPCRAFRLLLHELGDLAGQRELVAENLQHNVVRELHLLAKEMRDERKKHLSEGSKQMSTLQSALGALERARRAYERAARDSERALEAFHKADADLNLSRAEVEKQKAHMKQRGAACEDARAEYADQLRKTNDAQRMHYEIRLPHVFKELQDLDEKRIKSVKNFMLSSVEVERNVFPIIMQCLSGMEQAANQINEKEDTALVVERYKSGFLPPGDIPFEEQRAGGDATDSSHPPHHLHHLTAARGTISGGKLKKRVGLFAIFGSNKNNMSLDGKEDYSDLPPNQKRKRLQTKVQELQRQLNQEQASMDGLMKMKGVYEANPTLGDPMTVEGQLNECSNKVEKLRTELRKFEELLEAATQAALPHQHHHAPHPHNTQHIHQHLNGTNNTPASIGSNNSESLSRSASDSSVSTSGRGAGGGGSGAERGGGAGGSPESGLGGELAPQPDQHPNNGDIDHDDEFYYEPDLQPLGYCKALYPFEGNGTSSTMCMSSGERLLVLEMDAGDGWTRVRRDTSGEEGFVPTTYIVTTLYADTH